jgi:hypothetical protein
MRKLLKMLVVACALLCGAKAHAGPYGDDLSKCLVKATSSDDQIVFTQWMFAAMSLHPAVSGLVSITDEQRAALNKKAAALILRLVTKDCRQQAIDALKYVGPTVMTTSFNVFGQAAARGLIVHPRVAESLRTFGKDNAVNEQLTSLFRDAGIAPETPK